MSYLNSLRFNFTGQFQAAPSTVNNDPLHFDNRTFKPSYQQPGAGAQNGWWNPTGDAVWRLIGCKVSGVWMGNAPAPVSDPIHGYLVADSDRSVSAKLVDLDPEQQSVSEIWGMQVRICTPDGTNLMRSRYATAPFNDIWDRAPGGGDLIAGAAYQSVLDDIEWGDIGNSPFLQALRAASAESRKLSIKFNVDGYDMTPTSPNFTRGRIIGSIGPSAAGEPNHFVIGRHFTTTDRGGGNFFVPSGNINFCPAVVDAGAGKIYLDLGNALPTTVSGGPIKPLGTLTLGYMSGAAAIDSIDYQTPDWYESTAGVVEAPAGRKLTADELKGIASNPLTLTLTDAQGNNAGSAGEPQDGLYARADQFVYRLSPGDEAEVRVFATTFGQPYAGARVVSIFDASQLQPQSPLGPAPAVATPESAVEFPARIVADGHGLARLAIRASDPGNPRHYIDGQVYGVRPILEASLAYGTGDSYNPWDFVSLLVFNTFQPDEPITWFGSLQPIFQQYANLYPVMKKFLDMADYDSVCANAKLLQLAFGLVLEDPNSMPITRDLSPAKRKAILRWLNEPGEDGKPRKGTPPPEAALAATPEPAPVERPDDGPVRGGKASAMSRRLMFQRRR